MCGGPMSSPSSSPGGVLRCLGPESQLGASLDTDEPPCTSPPPIENFGPTRSGRAPT
ncbi:unnamed protein product [Ixodes persulcatus]